MRWILVAIVLALAGTEPARADGIQTGEQLLANCQSKKEPETTSCHAYILGAVDAIYTNQSMTFVCTFISPDGFSGEKAIDVVLEYLKAHPDDRSKSGAYTVSAALSAAYPCPK
jgi:hypothetical protein